MDRDSDIAPCCSENDAGAKTDSGDAAATPAPEIDLSSLSLADPPKAAPAPKPAKPVPAKPEVKAEAPPREAQKHVIAEKPTRFYHQSIPLSTRGMDRFELFQRIAGSRIASALGVDALANIDGDLEKCGLSAEMVFDNPSCGFMTLYRFMMLSYYHELSKMLARVKIRGLDYGKFLQEKTTQLARMQLAEFERFVMRLDEIFMVSLQEMEDGDAVVYDRIDAHLGLRITTDNFVRLPKDTQDYIWRQIHRMFQELTSYHTVRARTTKTNYAANSLTVFITAMAAAKQTADAAAASSSQ
jgi:hypothetical protein